MEITNSNTKVFDYVRFFKIAAALSTLAIIVSLLSFWLRGFNLGIDFTGGILLEVNMPHKIELQTARTALEQNGIKEATLQDFGTQGLMIRVASDKSDSGDNTQQLIVERIKQTLTKQFGQEIQFQRVDFVGPQVGNDLIIRGLMALGFSFLAIMLYIWIRFDWEFGIGVMLALMHDALLMFGFYSITGLNFDFTAIIAILTVVGYSVNNSVVLYDRLREYRHKMPGTPLNVLINLSTKVSLKRTLLTSCSTSLALIALVIFGGDTLASFSCGTLFGVVIGTYSSIYIAMPILLQFFPIKNSN